MYIRYQSVHVDAGVPGAPLGTPLGTPLGPPGTPLGPPGTPLGPPRDAPRTPRNSYGPQKQPYLEKYTALEALDCCVQNCLLAPIA